MSNYESNAIIQWDERKVTMTSPDSIIGAVPYSNPPKGFVLRGVRYEYGGADMFFRGKNDGVEFLSAYREGVDARLWVSEQIEGEYVQRLIPLSMKDADFVVPK